MDPEWCLLIYPEGRREDTKDHAWYLCKQTACPLPNWASWQALKNIQDALNVVCKLKAQVMKTACPLPKLVPNDDTYIQTTSPVCPLSSMDPPTEMEDRDSHDKEDGHFTRYPNCQALVPTGSKSNKSPPKKEKKKDWDLGLTR